MVFLNLATLGSKSLETSWEKKFPAQKLYLPLSTNNSGKNSYYIFFTQYLIPRVKFQIQEEVSGTKKNGIAWGG